MVFSNATVDPSLPADSSSDSPCILLVGAGVVGRAILAEHLRRGFNVLLLDLSEAALQRAMNEAVESSRELQTLAVPSPLPGLAAVRLGHDVQSDWTPELLIESIPENLELKRTFFASAGEHLDAACILASNTSNLRVAEVFDQLSNRSNCLGVHFFMPVGNRPLVELIPCAATEPRTLQRCRQHAGWLGKDALVTRDSPGFVVNRMLAPYLNQSLLLLGRGATPELIATAAARFGMPLSPLELIDLIGIRTAFDSGRVFWRSFPKRIDPAPILSGMIKAGRLGADFGGGFFAAASSWTQGDGNLPAPRRSRVLHPEAGAVIDRYQRDRRSWNEAEILSALSLPMWIEAAEILAADVVDSFEAIELGLRGGLGFQRADGFFAFFDHQSGGEILAQLEASAGQASFTAPSYLCDQLRLGSTPSDAILRYVTHSRDQAAAVTTGTKT